MFADGWHLLGAFDELERRRRTDYDTLRTKLVRSLLAQDGSISSHPLPAAQDPGMAPLLVDQDHAAAVLGVHRATVKRLIASGQLPAVKLGKLTRIRTADLEAYVDSLATA